MKIRKDERGLYIRGRFYKAGEPDNPYRPGNVPGYDHVYDMSNGGLKEGDNPKTHHVAGAPLIKITLPDRVLYWAEEYTLNQFAKKEITD